MVQGIELGRQRKARSMVVGTCHNRRIAQDSWQRRGLCRAGFDSQERTPTTLPVEEYYYAHAQSTPTTTTALLSD
jgi:hypothetical protein